MVKLTFYGGVNEIGGNKIVLEDGDTRIVLDFGLAFKQMAKFFSDFLQPRRCNGIGDLVELGLLPKLRGLYRQDYLRHACGLKGADYQEEELGFQALLLTHAHADHASCLHHLRPDLPIHCSKATYAILKALTDTSATSFCELSEFQRCFETYVNQKGAQSRKTVRQDPTMVFPRAFNLFDFGQKFRVGSVDVVPFQVDHSLPGATAYILYTSAGAVVYTGDFRFSGRNADKMPAFVEACRQAKPELLVVEGTRIAENATGTEQDIEADVAATVSKTAGLTVCSWPVRDTDRMTSFLQAARNVNRKLAISLKQAYLINCLAENGVSGLPKLDDPNIALYAMKKGWGLVGSNWDPKLVYEDYEKWEQPFLDRAVCYRNVAAEQAKYMMFCTNYDLKELIDLRPQAGSCFIKSTCEPYDDEMTFEWNRTKNWLDHFRLGIHRTHVSGHASGPQLKDFALQTAPKRIVPVHTEHADLYEQWFPQLVHRLKNAGDSLTI